MSAISTHVLDTAAGRPAAGMRVRLERVAAGSQAAAGQTAVGPVATPAAEEIAAASTDAGGRIASLGPEVVEPGIYRLIFDTGDYLARPPGADSRGASDSGASDSGASDSGASDSGTDGAPFFPEVTVTFAVAAGEHYHVPLLLSPFGYSTYRGS